MFERVKAIIEEKLNADGETITESTDFKEDLNADSLDLCLRWSWHWRMSSRWRFPQRIWKGCPLWGMCWSIWRRSVRPYKF